ncbi:MAG: glycoside hydrolase family 99-like domain-containing protein, partial [Flavobacteriaceae bacterium]|nr:glycoside hydrolase family 99-like domain-containing protein [Flavobacteriaceae bacterium]
MKKCLLYLSPGTVISTKIYLFSKTTLLLGILIVVLFSSSAEAQQTKLNMKVGAYYFDGWAGKNRNADKPDEPWAKNAPSHLTRRMVEEFADREPVWGWRDDSQEIMERQIDLAADNGIEFFLFCWYWRDTNGPINVEAIENLSLHTSLNLYMKAKNKHRIKFSFLVANHGGSEIKGAENWGKATEYWAKYFKDPQFVTVDGKPLVVVFNANGIDDESIARMQETSKKAGLPGLSIAG